MPESGTAISKTSIPYLVADRGSFCSVEVGECITARFFCLSGSGLGANRLAGCDVAHKKAAPALSEKDLRVTRISDIALSSSPT